MFRYDVTIFSSFLGLLLYAGLIGSVHPAIILLLLVLSVLQFLSYRRAASYEVRRRDDLSAIKLSQRYFQKQSYDTAAGKDVRLYQLGGWIDGVYRQINKRYQKILFHIRSAYFANDLLTLTLQLLRRRHLLWLSDLPPRTRNHDCLRLCAGARRGFRFFFVF